MKTIVVTGGTKGIGKAIILKFASEGYDIVTCARNEDDLKAFSESVREKYQVGFYYQAVDLSIKSSVEKFTKYVLSLDVKIDVLINNTGVYLPGKIYEEEDGALELMINTNLYSAYYLTRGLLPKMINSKTGDIFNICSTASVIPYINGGSYCISKYALYGMTKVLREEMKEHQIRVVAVLPGATYTSSWEGVDVPEERFMKASDVADSIFGTHQLSNRTVVEEILIRPLLGDL